MSKICDVCEEKADIYCNDCTKNKFFCTNCFNFTHPPNSAKSKHSTKDANEIQDERQIGEIVLCPLHPNKEKEYACLECDVVVCADCIAFGEHCGHKMSNFTTGLEEAAKKFTADGVIEANLKDLIDKDEEKILKFIDDDIAKIKHLQKTTEDAFQKLLELVDGKRKEVIAIIEKKVSKRMEERNNINNASEELFLQLEGCTKILQGAKANPNSINVSSYDSFTTKYSKIKQIKSALIKWSSAEAFREREYVALPLEELEERVSKINVNEELFEPPPSILKNTSIVNEVKDQLLLQTWVSEAHDNSQIRFQLLYRGSTDGFDSRAFHSKCDNKGPTLAIIASEQGAVFGGYTSLLWRSSGKFTHDAKAFIYSLTRKAKHARQKDRDSVYYDERFGPTFGSGFDICVVDGCNVSNKSYSQGNGTYELPPSADTQTYYAGAFKFKIKEIEVYEVLKHCA
eukprot:TRINITY_DN1171_c0_g3_i1.p1 TRINITY_DN1171_c0_g3~~TRINITY_DN1171_c0_g3_i1.p1  ORF type:complete len:457 (-),score=138.02 TRINITY_DN1171_c0_g3_i1:155-1525(-)